MLSEKCQKTQHETLLSRLYLEPKLEIDNELLQTAFTTIKDGPSITKAFENAINAKVTSLMKKEQLV